MPDNVPQALNEIVLWLDDNLANEEDALFERRAELIEMALRKAMALSVPTPPSVPTAAASSAELLCAKFFDDAPDYIKRYIYGRGLCNAIEAEIEAAHKAGRRQEAEWWEAQFVENGFHAYEDNCGANICVRHKRLAALRATPAAPEEPRT